jgi:hypothetical protein
MLCRPCFTVGDGRGKWTKVLCHSAEPAWDAVFVATQIVEDHSSRANNRLTRGSTWSNEEPFPVLECWLPYS